MPRSRRCSRAHRRSARAEWAPLADVRGWKPEGERVFDVPLLRSYELKNNVTQVAMNRFELLEPAALDADPESPAAPPGTGQRSAPRARADRALRCACRGRQRAALRWAAPKPLSHVAGTGPALIRVLTHWPDLWEIPRAHARSIAKRTHQIIGSRSRRGRPSTDGTPPHHDASLAALPAARAHVPRPTQSPTDRAP